MKGWLQCSLEGVGEAPLTFWMLSMEELQVSVLVSSSEKTIYQESLSVAELVSIFLHMKASPRTTPFDTEILTSPSFNNLYVYV